MTPRIFDCETRFSHASEPMDHLTSATSQQLPQIGECSVATFEKPPKGEVRQIDRTARRAPRLIRRPMRWLRPVVKPARWTKASHGAMRERSFAISGPFASLKLVCSIGKMPRVSSAFLTSSQ
jgi:hypothetical protein